MKQFNIVVLGAGGVGKDVFVENYDPTIEEEYRRTITVDGQLSAGPTFDTFNRQLEVLDTAGAEQFTSLNEVYIKAGRGFVLVFRLVHLLMPYIHISCSFSLTNEASLREVENLRKQIYRIKGEDRDVPIVVVGTKLDLAGEREVQRTTISTLANRWALPFYETSAKKNWHIAEVFEDLVKQMRQKYPQEVQKQKKRSYCIIM
ncbi:hypothetical protein C0995_002368 [Termitomyces sp. Mi166|nr:hypothetical protein C0995_002368 [Termitomyces sp. Mi166\